MAGRFRIRLCSLFSGAGSVGLSAFSFVRVLSPPLLSEFCSYFFCFSLANLLSAIFVMLNVKKDNCPISQSSQQHRLLLCISFYIVWFFFPIFSIFRQSINPANNIGYYCVSRFILCEFFSIFSVFSRANLLFAIYVMLNVKMIIRQPINQANNIGYYCVSRFIIHLVC